MQHGQTDSALLILQGKVSCRTGFSLSGAVRALVLSHDRAEACPTWNVSSLETRELGEERKNLDRGLPDIASARLAHTQAENRNGPGVLCSPGPVSAR